MLKTAFVFIVIKTSLLAYKSKFKILSLNMIKVKVIFSMKTSNYAQNILQGRSRAKNGTIEREIKKKRHSLSLENSFNKRTKYKATPCPVFTGII